MGQNSSPRHNPASLPRGRARSFSDLLVFLFRRSAPIPTGKDCILKEVTLGWGSTFPQGCVQRGALFLCYVMGDRSLWAFPSPDGALTGHRPWGTPTLSFSTSALKSCQEIKGEVTHGIPFTFQNGPFPQTHGCSFRYSFSKQELISSVFLMTPY